MPEISRFYGIVIRMFYNDHNPPHFHLDYQGYQAIVTIESGLVKGEMPRRALKLIFDWMDLHQAELQENWERAQAQEQLKKIEPLKYK